MVVGIAPISVQVFILLDGDLDGPNHSKAVIDWYWDRFVKIERYWDYEKLLLEISSSRASAHRVCLLGRDASQHGFFLFGVPLVFSCRGSADH